MKYTHFKQQERSEIAILLKKGYSQRDIAYALGRSPSSVSREITRNLTKGGYDPRQARHKARVRRRYARYQGMKIKEDPGIESYLEEKLRLSWSPEAIAGRMKKDLGRSVHHTTIYKYLYSIHGQRLCKYLRYQRYRRRKRVRVKSTREIIKNRVFIDERSEMINGRKRFGDFEGDTLGVPRSSRQTVAAVIERKSRFILARKINQLKYAMEGFKNILKPLPVLSLTLDNGVENARYSGLNITTYFCHPYSAWEKGAIENAFKLVREYLPKKRVIDCYSSQEITEIIDLINNRPRKCLNWLTPKEVFNQYLAHSKCCTSG